MHVLSHSDTRGNHTNALMCIPIKSESLRCKINACFQNSRAKLRSYAMHVCTQKVLSVRASGDIIIMREEWFLA